ncbi:hypothetical protein D3C71_1411670 [compost metagenome]
MLENMPSAACHLKAVGYEPRPVPKQGEVMTGFEPWPGLKEQHSYWLLVLAVGMSRTVTQRAIGKDRRSDSIPDSPKGICASALFLQTRGER